MKPFLLLLSLCPLLLLATPKNIIVMVPDGTGHASLTVARQLKGAPLNLDDAIYGVVQTRSADNSVTDSAAAATAMSCGQRTYNGAVAVDSAKVPLRTFGEWAKSQGKAVGIVTTDSIVGATPAAFSVHAASRGEVDAILEQQIASGFEVFLGGGRKLLTGDRKAFLVEQGYTLATDADDLKAAQGKIFGLFSDGIMTAKVTRRGDILCIEPTLPEMVSKALEVLSADPDGFFLMIEGAQVDKGNHQNDLPWATYELLEFDVVVGQVLDWAKAHPGTVVLIAPDHETGGLTVLNEPKEGSRVKALQTATTKKAGKPKDYFVKYSTDWHTGVDVFRAGNDSSVCPLRNCDFLEALVGIGPQTLRELGGITETRNGAPTLITPDGRMLRAHRDAVYVKATGKWYAR